MYTIDTPVLKDKLLWILLLIMVISFIASLAIGSTTIGLEQLIDTGHPDHSIGKKIILQHRLPRTLTAILTGIALPLSGWVLQEFFRNPLAGPSVLGVTSAAGLGVAIVIILGTTLGLGTLIYEPVMLIIGALIGAFVAMIILVTIAKRIVSTTALIIVGFMIAALAGSLISILQYISNAEELKSYVMWSFGSLNGLGYTHLLYYTLFVLVGIWIILQRIPDLVKMQLGEYYAQTMGVNVKQLRIRLIIASSILAAVATALVGPISFIGLAVPHICRMYLKTANFKKLFIYINVVGITLMIIFGLIAELFPGGALPINVITALFGAPIVLSIVFNHKRQLS